MVSTILFIFSQTTFAGFDRDRSGNIDSNELQQALLSFGYRLSPQALGGVIRRYSNGGKIVFDQFVGLCVKLRMVTSK